MADLQAVREGLAGNLAALRTAGTVGQVSAYMLDNPTPPALLVAGVAAEGVDLQAYGGIAGGFDWTLLVEATLGRTSDIGSQRLLNTLLSGVLVDAVLDDPQLTKRLRDDGSLVTGQAAAASSVAFAGYRGQSSAVLESGSRVLLAIWAFRVFA